MYKLCADNMNKYVRVRVYDKRIRYSSMLEEELFMIYGNEIFQWNLIVQKGWSEENKFKLKIEKKKKKEIPDFLKS